MFLFVLSKHWWRTIPWIIFYFILSGFPQKNIASQIFEIVIYFDRIQDGRFLLLLNTSRKWKTFNYYVLSLLSSVFLFKFPSLWEGKYLVYRKCQKDENERISYTFGFNSFCLCFLNTDDGELVNYCLFYFNKYCVTQRWKIIVSFRIQDGRL